MALKLLKRAAVVIFICFQTVNSLVHVCAPVGSEVLLPCVCSKQQQLPQTFTVLWKDKEQRIMLDIINGSPKFHAQHRMFRGRVESFPDLCREGNFSILMKSLQKSDSSSYNCYSKKLHFNETVHLTVSDKCDPRPLRTPRSSAGDTRLTSDCLHLIMSLRLPFLLLW